MKNEIKKVPYQRDSHEFTVAGPLLEFNGTVKPFLSPLEAIRFSLENPLHGIVRVGGNSFDNPFRYFLNGKEYKAADLFTD
jgi:hypothetical protein